MVDDSSASSLTVEGKGKAFDYALYEKNTAIANEVIRNCFKRLYVVARDTETEEFGIDCDLYVSEDAYKSGKEALCQIELEVRKCYETGIGFINFLERKQKLFITRKIPFWFVCNQKGTQGYITPMTKIMKCPTQQELMANTGRIEVVYKVNKSFVNYGLENIETAILEYCVSVVNEQYKGILGINTDMYNVDTLKDTDITHIFDVVNRMYCTMLGMDDYH